MQQYRNVGSIIETRVPRNELIIDGEIEEKQAEQN